MLKELEPLPIDNVECIDLSGHSARGRGQLLSEYRSRGWTIITISGNFAYLERHSTLPITNIQAFNVERICPECGTEYVMNTLSHTHCTVECYNKALGGRDFRDVSDITSRQCAAKDCGKDFKPNTRLQTHCGPECYFKDYPREKQFYEGRYDPGHSS